MAREDPAPGNGQDMSASFVTTSLVGAAVSLPIIATATTILRFYARRTKRDGLSRGDDWMLLITLAMCWAHSINTLVAGGIGGINSITMPPEKYATVALRTLFIWTFFLTTALYTVKTPILLFYYCIFSVKAWFRRAVVTMIVILSLWWVSFITLAFLSTTPIEAAWENAAHAKHRFDFNTWYISYSGISILFDVIILCFPIPMVKSLNINTKQKISILGIFWLGGFICVSAIIRFVLLYKQIYQLTDYGKNFYPSITTAFIWAEVEPNTSVIAACLPTYGPLFKEGRLFPRLLRSLRSVLHTPTKSLSNNFGTSTNNTNPSGYYELDRIVVSKDMGDLFAAGQHGLEHTKDMDYFDSHQNDRGVQ